MIQTEKMIVKEIVQLLNSLDAATYGEYKTNGVIIRPSISRFYHITRKLYELTDELVDKYNPQYITSSDYKFICESQRDTLFRLAVLKDNKTLDDMEITRELETYLSTLHGLFHRITDCFNKQG